MSKRSQSTLAKFIAHNYRGKPVSIYALTKAYGLSLSEVNRLVDAMLKNDKLSQAPDGGLILGKPLDARKKKKKTSAAEEDSEEDSGEVVTRKQRRPSHQYMAFGWVAGTELTDEDEKKLVKTYTRKYGKAPNQINNAGSCILLGPIPAEFNKG
jgi:hypothetical protein